MKQKRSFSHRSYFRVVLLLSCFTSIHWTVVFTFFQGSQSFGFCISTLVWQTSLHGFGCRFHHLCAGGAACCDPATGQRSPAIRGWTIFSHAHRAGPNTKLFKQFLVKYSNIFSPKFTCNSQQERFLAFCIVSLRRFNNQQLQTNPYFRKQNYRKLGN